MELILIRHAHATWTDRTWSNDDRRELTPLGDRQAHAVGRALGRALDGVDVLWTTPLTRARRTAEIVADVAGWKPPEVLDVDDRNEPYDDAVLRRLTTARGERVGYVGHEPTMSRLVSLLVAGAAAPARFEMERCASALLRLDGGGRAVLAWLLVPELLDGVHDDREA